MRKVKIGSSLKMKLENFKIKEERDAWHFCDIFIVAAIIFSRDKRKRKSLQSEKFIISGGMSRPLFMKNMF